MTRSDIMKTLRRSRRWWFEKALAPMLRRTAGFLSGWAAAVERRPAAPDEWKKKALDDFSSWLSTLPEDGGPQTAEPETCDLYTVLTEFAALRQEIRMQNRQQRTTVRAQETLADRFDGIGKRLDERIDQLGHMQEEQRRRIEDAAISPFLDIRDALVRGKNAAESMAQPQGFFRRAPKGAGAVADGYAMALRRMDRALDRLGIKPVAAVGAPFDPSCMRAVEKRTVAEKASGAVIEEILGGFVRGREVIRTAEVVINDKSN